MYVAPKFPKGGSKTQNGRFSSKIALRLKKVCYKVYSCENCQRQSCRAFIGLTIHAKIIGGDVPFYIGVARILSAWVHFFTTQQKLLKIDSCSGWGVHLVSCGGALTHFSCKLGLENFFFHRGGVQVHPLHPPGYAYAY